VTEIQCLKIKFRRDKAEEAVRWVHSLKERQEEVAELLDAEGIRVESLFLERSGQDVYLYQYVRANSLEQAYEAFMKSQISISEETRQFIDEMWEDGQSLELVVDFERP
jgi:L-rhamnose mutarotase